MKIQIITQGSIEQSKDIKINSFENLEALDNYDINIFDLSDSFWRSKSTAIGSVNLINDIKHIRNLINTATNKNNIIILPQNTKYKYNYKRYQNALGSTVTDYVNSDYLKNCFDVIKNIISANFVLFPYELGYEKNVTIINGTEFKSDFYILLNGTESGDILTKSKNSNKATSIKTRDGMVITTLSLLQEQLIKEYLIFIGFISNGVNKPPWIDDIEIINDRLLKAKKSKMENEVAEILEEIKKIDIDLSENNKYKSILYETGASLNAVVNQILSEIFDVSAKEFVDVYEEDFLLKLEDITFVIEIKGVVHNINGKNVSDAFNHVQIYLDDVENKGIEEKVKGIFIVANQREISPKERVPINERQINIAKRNDLLIVKTEDLLKFYEKYIIKEITKEEIKKIFADSVGLLNL